MTVIHLGLHFLQGNTSWKEFREGNNMAFPKASDLKLRNAADGPATKSSMGDSLIAPLAAENPLLPMRHTGEDIQSTQG